MRVMFRSFHFKGQANVFSPFLVTGKKICPKYDR